LVFSHHGFLRTKTSRISLLRLPINAGFGQNEEFNAIAVAVLGGTSLFGGRGTVFPGTVLGTILVQMVTSGLIFAHVDIYLQPLVYAGIIFLAVLLDSLRTAQLEKLERRHIRIEKTA
jgi:ribose/xylose/arabinose/galactoside ABC-type transport system permease subunit